MATIGERLTEARKNFGIDIRSAAEATKIRSDFLAALEENKPERIKLADVYKVGFLRIYAKYLKLDADRIVAEFRTAQSFHGQQQGRGAHRLLSSSASDEPAGTGVAAGMEKSGIFEDGGNGVAALFAFFRSGGKRLAVAVAVVAVVLAAVIFGAVKIFGGNAASGTETVAAEYEEPTPDTQAYEFLVVSKVPQFVTITDRFGSDSRVVLLDEQVSANRPLTLTGRGVLEIRDGGGNNLEIRFPEKAALLASKNAKETVKLTEEDKRSVPFSHGTKHWTANPYLESR